MSLFGATSLRGKILTLKIAFAAVVALAGLAVLYRIENEEKSRPRVDAVKEREEITAGLQSENPAERAQACIRLGKYRPLTKENIEALATALADKDTSVRTSAATALAEIAPMLESKPEWAEPAAAAAGKALDDPDSAVALPAITTLSQCGDAGRAAITPLKKQLQTKDFARRLAAVAALHKLNPATVNETLPVVIALVDDANDATRLQALQMLGKFGNAGKETSPQLIKIATSKQDRKVRIAAAETLLQVDPDEAPQAATALVTLIKEIDAETGDKLKKPTITKGPDGRTIVLSNPDVLGNPLNTVRADAVRVLRRADAEAADAVNQ